VTKTRVKSSPGTNALDDFPTFSFTHLDRERTVYRHNRKTLTTGYRPVTSDKP